MLPWKSAFFKGTNKKCHKVATEIKRKLHNFIHFPKGDYHLLWETLGDTGDNNEKKNEI